MKNRFFSKMESPIPNPPSPDSEMFNKNIDTNNSVLDEIMKMKQRRLMILHQLNKEHGDELSPIKDEVQENVKKKEKPIKINRKSQIESIPVRRSKRISSKNEEDQYKINEIQKPVITRLPNHYGATPGIEVGHHWNTRLECSYDGVHKPTVAGIHAGPRGAYSIALSGGYPEDIDEGHTFTYTGAGGRDLKGTATKPKNLRTAPQTKNQELEGANYSLVKSIKTGEPVRVIRGYKSDSVFAPETGYRYDGLYRVVKYWEDFGKTGYRIFRYKMERLSGQMPAPWERQKKMSKKFYYRKKENKALNTSLNELSEQNANNDDLRSCSIINSHSYKFINGNDRIASQDENQLDSEIKIYNDKLCQNSTVLSKFGDCFTEEDNSFHGWD